MDTNQVAAAATDDRPAEENEAENQQPEQTLSPQPASARNIALITLAVLAVFYTLYFAASIILPLVFAVVVNLLLQPAKRLLHEKLHIPAALTSLLLILAMLFVIAAIGTAISVPASSWIKKAPESFGVLQERLGFLAAPIEFVRHGLSQIHDWMEPQAAGGQQQVAVQQSSNIGGIGMTVLAGTRAALGQLLTFAVTLFFMLTSGETLLKGVVEVTPTTQEKRRVVAIASQIEQNISGYLVTITIMNVLVGLANGLAMWLLGMPDPLLWGTLAFLLNYIPILGPITGIVIFFFVGLLSSPSLVWALLPPGIYLAVHIVEGETVTPMLLARRFTLNPVLLIVSLFFWDWLWGVSGALLAVPLLAIFKIVCDRIPKLMPLGHILGAEKNKPPPKSRTAKQAG